MLHNKRKDHVAHVSITDGLIDAIGERIASVPPERGGALLGFGNLVHLLIEDTHGEYSSASWDISRSASEAVGVIEAAEYGQLCGTVHSHPVGIPDPSSTDINTTIKALQMNPHLSKLLIAIVTVGEPREMDVAIPGGCRMSIHEVGRGRGILSKFHVRRAEIEIKAVSKELRDFGASYVSAITTHMALDGAPNRLGLSHIFEDGDGERLSVGFKDALGGSQVIRVHGDYPRVPFGIDPVKLLPSGADSVGGMQLTSDDSRVDGESRYSRIIELTGPLNDQNVLVAGGGSVGSRIAEELARSGVESFILADPDTVSESNLARSVYVDADIGRPKVEALKDRLQAINPRITVDTLQSSLADVDFDSILDSVTFVVLATDDMSQQAYLSSECYMKGVPQVAAAMYRKGAAGEVVIVCPSANTPCWSCCVGMGSFSSIQRPDVNYGVDSRLVAESALGSSINVVTSLASLVSIGVMAGPQSTVGSYLAESIAVGRTLALVSVSPAWDFFPKLFDGMSHQLFPQSVWVRINRNDECPVCGLRPDPTGI